MAAAWLKWGAARSEAAAAAGSKGGARRASGEAAALASR